MLVRIKHFNMEFGMSPTWFRNTSPYIGKVVNVAPSIHRDQYHMTDGDGNRLGSLLESTDFDIIICDLTDLVENYK